MFVPSYNQNIFSVQAVTSKGCIISFETKNAQLKIPNRKTSFNIVEYEKYYLFTSKITLNSKFDFETWHKILGHCYIDDVMKLPNVVNGMQISSNVHDKCPTCLLGKMPQYIS